MNPLPAPRASFAHLLTLLGTLSLLAGVSHATPLIYSLSGTATGTLGTTPFTDAHFEIDLPANSASVTNPATGIYRVTGTATIAIDGFGTATLTDVTSVVDNQNPPQPALVFGDATQNYAMLVAKNDPVFTSCNLRSAVGPITSTAASSPNAGITYPTTLGPIEFLSVSATTFTASVVPEPASRSLTGIAAGAMVLRRRRSRSV